MPYTDEGPTDGSYYCTHTATSAVCAAVLDSASTGATVKDCRADLLSANSFGDATLVQDGVAAWTCATGDGGGTFVYRPGAEAPVVFPVTLALLEDHWFITGRYFQAGTGRTIVVRATIPAVCAANTSSPTGYQGTVTPV